MQDAVRAQHAADSLAVVLRRLRMAAGLSQEELARRAKLSTDAVSALERGTRRRPYPATLRAIADALQLSASERADLLAAVTAVKFSSVGASRDPPGLPDLPAAPTPLLGRDDDLAMVSRLLGDSENRLVTLTGIGGVGKTRLAVAVAERTAGLMRDGTVFVPLANVSDVRLVLTQIGRTAGLTSAGSHQTDDDVLTALADAEKLFVLDNLEHLPEAGLIVARLLSSCPGVSVLATTRSPLGIRGETEWPVHPLGLPDLTVTSVADLANSPAANLLLERGRALRPGLHLGPDDVPSIVEICHRVAGIPLALELAAAGLRVLSPAELLSRLETVVHSSGALIDLPERQRSLRATLDYSYALLTPQEQTVFRRLSIFVGGFDLDAAHAVVADTDTLSALGRLTEQSLVTASSIHGVTRYGLLEPVVQYAQSLLTPSELDLVARTHTQYYLELAERAAPALRGPGQVAWLERMTLDDGNLSAALRRAIDSAEGEIAGRLTWALWMCWWMQGRLMAGRHLLDEVLALQLSDAVRARVLVAIGAVTDPASSDAPGLERKYEEALVLAQRADDSEAIAAAESALGLAALRRGDYEQAEEHLARAESAASLAGEAGQWYADLSKVAIGAARRFRGHPASAQSFIRAGLDDARRRGDDVTTGMALYNLGQAALAQNLVETAREHLGDAAELCADIGDAANLSYVLDALATVEYQSGRAVRSATLLGAAQAMRDATPVGGHDYYGPDTVLRDRTADDLRRSLGEQELHKAVQRGRRMDITAVVGMTRQA